MVAIVFEFSRVYFRAVLARHRAHICSQSSLGAQATTPPCKKNRNNFPRDSVDCVLMFLFLKSCQTSGEDNSGEHESCFLYVKNVSQQLF